MNNTDKIRMAANEEDVRKAINAHPLHSEQIANMLHINVGEVNKAVLALRSRGYLICGDDAYEGYYIGCLAEVEKTLTVLEEQKKQLDLAIRFMSSSTSHKKERTAEQMSMRV